MAGNLSEEQRRWILKTYWKYENAEIVRRLWEFNVPVPSRLTIYRIRDKFEATGSITNAPKSGRPRTSLTEVNKLNTALTFIHSPKKSRRRASLELGIPRTSLKRLMNHLKLKPYRPRLLHSLLEDDPDRRLQFCEIMHNQLIVQPDLLSKIVWTDEACFKLSGHVNRHNCVYWADENPHVIMTSQLNQPGVTVWGGISCDGVIGPVFIDGTVDSHKYLDMLTDVVVPQLRTRPNFAELYFQQDGAPPHYSLDVRGFLDEVFPHHWIGRRGSIEWPPRSPDLTPMDFFFWGVVKDKVYSMKPVTVPQLKNFINDAFEDIRSNRNLCRTVCESVKDRMQECINVEGGHFEHLRD